MSFRLVVQVNNNKSMTILIRLHKQDLAMCLIDDNRVSSDCFFLVNQQIVTYTAVRPINIIIYFFSLN